VWEPALGLVRAKVLVKERELVPEPVLVPAVPRRNR
jgi:hypothetical protein